jgi:phage terminase small subunit
MLNTKQSAFCDEYIVDFNGAAAAERAGYKKNRARITASELLVNPKIAARIKELIDVRKEKMDVSADQVINELKAIAFARTTDYVKVKEITVQEGRKRRKIRAAFVELTSDVPEEKQKAISEIKQTKDGISLKSHDKVKALELIGRHLGIFEKDNQQKKPSINLGNLPITFE